MQVTVETLEGLERRLNITVPAANIEDAVTAELRNIAKTVVSMVSVKVKCL